VLASTRGIGIGHEIVALDGSSWGLAVSDDSHCWHLAGGRIAQKNTEGKKWQWKVNVSPLAAQNVQPCGEAAADDSEAVLAEPFLVHICSWLVLKWAQRALITCRGWKGVLQSRVPLTLPPPQSDALLEFCLLEVLVRFDDARLPLPLSAIYNEMLVAGRRIANDPRSRQHLEASICQFLGPSCKAQQQQFLKDIVPHHIAWSPDVKTAGFRSLERLGKHFHNERLIETYHQTWHKRIHHSPNTRTCQEWLLTLVNRSHKLYTDHLEWVTASTQQ